MYCSKEETRKVFDLYFMKLMLHACILTAAVAVVERTMHELLQKTRRTKNAFNYYELCKSKSTLSKMLLQ